MFRAALVLGLLAGLLAAPSAAAQVAETRIIGGAYHPGFSFMTSIKSPNSGCTATLIAPKRVLTAGHCVMKDGAPELADPPGSWTAAVGATNEDTTGVRRQVTGIAVHPLYDNPAGGPHVNHPRYDIAVMFLRSPVPNAPVTIGTASTWGSTGTVLGWGHVNPDHNNPLNDPNLKGGTLRLWSDSQCLGYAGSHYIPAIHVCADSADASTCVAHGDSGGPLLVNGQQVGVTSHYAVGGSTCTPEKNFIQFAWVAGPTLRDFPFTAENPSCEPARKKFKRVKKVWRKRSKQFRRARNWFRATCLV